METENLKTFAIISHISRHNMKTYPLISVQVFRLAGLTQVIFLFLIWSLTNTCFGDPKTNNMGWSDNFEYPNYTNQTPLLSGTNGWYSSPGIYDTNCPPQTSIVQATVYYPHPSGTETQAAMIGIGDTLSNNFYSTNERIVRIEMYVQPQLMTSSVYPSMSADTAAQFFVNSNGYFVVGNGTKWNTITKKTHGAAAVPITNTYFTRVQVNLRYKNHTWNLKAWTNSASVTTLVAQSYYVNFTSNLNAFSGFAIYNGTATSYVDDVSVTNISYNLQPKINGVSFDAINNINGAQPALVNDVDE